MAKGPIVTNGVEALIVQVYRNHRKWKAREIRNEVSYFVRQNDPKLPHTFPSLSTVQKVLAKVRKSDYKPGDDPENKPFSFGATSLRSISPPILPQAVPILFDVMKLRADKGDHFTIREAKWASTLSPLVPDRQSLSDRATIYANAEVNCSILKIPFDSTQLDGQFFEAPEAEKESNKGAQQ